MIMDSVEASHAKRTKPRQVKYGKGKKDTAAGSSLNGWASEDSEYFARKAAAKKIATAANFTSSDNASSSNLTDPLWTAVFGSPCSAITDLDDFIENSLNSLIRPVNTRRRHDQLIDNDTCAAEEVIPGTAADDEQLAQEDDKVRNFQPMELPECTVKTVVGGDMSQEISQLDNQSRDDTGITAVTELHHHDDGQQFIEHDINATTSVSQGNHGNTVVAPEADEATNSTDITTVTNITNITNIELADTDVTRTNPLKHKSPRPRKPRLAYTNRASLSAEVDATDYRSAATKLQNWLAFNRRVNREEVTVDGAAIDTRRTDALLPSLVDGYFYDYGPPTTIRSKLSCSLSRNKSHSVGRHTPTRSSSVSESSVLYSSYRTTSDDATMSLLRQTQLIHEMQSSPQLFNSRQRELIGTVELRLDDPVIYAQHGIASEKRFDGAFIGARVLRQCPLADGGLGTFSSDVPTERLIPIASLLAAMDAPERTLKTRRTPSLSSPSGFAVSSTLGRHVIPATTDRSV